MVAALLRAAAAGKEVAAFVELKASYDEARNIAWVRQLERAGAQVVYGVVGLKNHAKVALVARREEGEIRRYVHVSTGELQCRDRAVLYRLGAADGGPRHRGRPGRPVQSVHRHLACAGRGAPPPAGGAGAPARPGLLDRIAREADHARAGRPGRSVPSSTGSTMQR